MPTTAEHTYLELADHVGLDDHGNPQPLAEIGFTFSVPVMGGPTGKDVVDDPYRAVIRSEPSFPKGGYGRFLPGTRLVEVADPRVVQALLQSGFFTETDKPDRQEQTKARKDTEDAQAAAATTTDDPEAAADGGKED